MSVPTAMPTAMSLQTERPGIDEFLANATGNSSSSEGFDPCAMIQEPSSPQKLLFAFIFYGVFLTTVGLLGIAGNIISITVLSRPKMRSSINCCLIGLTSFDMIVALTSILMFSIPAIGSYTGTMDWYDREFFPKAMPIVYPVGIVAQTGSIYLTVTVTMERYVAVCLPLRARYLCTYGRAKMYLIGVAVFSFIYNLPRFWEVSYQECHVDDHTYQVVVSTKLRTNQHYIQIYISWMYFFVMNCIPFSCLLLFNSFIYKRVQEANRERQHLSQVQKKEIGLAVMLLVVVLVFFVCNALAFIINLMELADKSIDEMVIISNLLVTINSSVNFIIYCIFGQKFRRLFLKMFCARFAPKTLIRAGVSNSTYGQMSRNGGTITESLRLTSWSDHRQSTLINPHDVHAIACPSLGAAGDPRLLTRDMPFLHCKPIQEHQQSFNNFN